MVNRLRRYAGQYPIPVVLLAYLALSVLLRLPFSFVSGIDWDEGTFVIMGQEILDGYLPYTRLWDFKPPLAFAAYALAIATLGHSIEAVRVAGTICVALTGLAVYVVARRAMPPVIARLAGVVTIVVMVAQRAGQATMTEHFAAAILTWGLVALLASGESRPILVIAGALLMAGALIRLHLAYTLAAVIVGAGLRPGGGPARRRIADVGMLVAGAVVTLSTVLAPYVYTGNHDVLIRSAALGLLAGGRGPWESFSAVVKLAGSLVHDPLLGLTVWAAGLLGSMLLFVRRTEGAEPKQWRFWLVVVLLSSSYSVIAIGAGSGHYLILLVPMYVLVAFAVMSRDSLNRRLRHAYFLVLAAGLLIALVPIASEYRDLSTRLLRDGHLRVGRAYELARILAAQSRAPVPMYLMEEHVVYWLTGNRPLTPMSTHPSNIAKRDILRVMRGPNATPIEELQQIFAQAPLFVARPTEIRYLKSEPAALTWLDGELASRYRLIDSIDGLQLYRLTSPPGATN